MWVEREVGNLPPGSAIDIACGERRKSVWFAARGLQVTGVDFSAEAIRKAETLSDGISVSWLFADATTLDMPTSFDLALMIYLQLPPPERAAALVSAWNALHLGGTTAGRRA